MMKGKSWDHWIVQYQASHQNRLNQLTHVIGIPMILVSLVLGLASLLGAGLWTLAIWLFVVGWALQFIGHAIEGKPPEFLRDWRFLLVGTRWWIAKLTGKV